MAHTSPMVKGSSFELVVDEFNWSCEVVVDDKD